MGDVSDLSERHEVRVRGQGHTIVFVAESRDGRLLIRQERDGKNPKEVCAITLSDPDELADFFEGLRRILASLGHRIESGEGPDASRGETPRALPGRRDDDDREAVVAQARQKNAQAFAPWTKEEEQEIRRRHAAGESIQAIARARKRSPRAIELRLQRLGVSPPDQPGARGSRAG